MRSVLWLLALFGIAVAVALFAGNNQGTVTLFWPPWRGDLSLNLVLPAPVGAFVLLHFALGALGALVARGSRPRRRDRLAEGDAAGRGAAHAGAAHEAEGRAARAPNGRSAGDGAAAGQAPRLLAGRRGKHRARAGGRPSQRRARRAAVATHVALARERGARHAGARHPR